MGSWSQCPHCQGAFLEGDESLWNEKAACSSVVRVSPAGILVASASGDFICILEEINLTRRLEITCLSFRPLGRFSTSIHPQDVYP